MTDRNTSWIRTCERELSRHGIDTASDSLDIDVLRYDAGDRSGVWLAHSLYRAFNDLNAGEVLYAFRGLLQARSYAAVTPGSGGACIADAMTTLQNEIEAALRSGEKAVR